ncbi:tripartite tricarboxylate transporter substrate-binding protein [Salinarimonas soli]|uniref:Tripartite tricarboxylate transporter substrate binding protein BugD n=1 Tax=Salinarimonas soli TaxID=1638099 RepID=A0A5B2VBA5_9HYPH|nr:tripartite tricarboxylate transporter substrate-binding protein [Salinarimonas soli]KAA2235730.1 tripartite tricarboxylate transporter substrate binding protein BugD [Salinarimonas soli]
MKRLLTLAAAAAFGVLGIAGAGAQGFPTRTITLVVPFAAGGPSDAIGRLVAQSMSQTLGQQVIVENVAGAGGTTGAARVAKAEPDGHTLLIHHLALPAGPALYKSLAYDTRTAFEPVGLVNTGPMALVSKKDFPAKTAKDLFAYLKRDGASVNIAHAGVGSNSHICAVMLSQAVGFKPTYVSYRGTGPAMNDLVGGQVDVLCDQSTTAVPQIEGGAVIGHAVTSAERLAVLKDVPTSAEAGLPALDMTVWHGIYAPAGTPKDRIATLHAALQKAIADPTIVERFAAVGTQVYPPAERSVDAHRKRFLAEIDRIAELMKAAGVAAQ